MFELRLFTPEVLEKGELYRGLHQESFAYSPLEARGKKETIAAAVRYSSVLELVALSMDKAPLKQADDFLVVFACEVEKEEVFYVPSHKKPVTKGNVVIFGIESIAKVSQQVVAGGEPSASRAGSGLAQERRTKSRETPALGSPIHAAATPAPANSSKEKVPGSSHH